MRIAPDWKDYSVIATGDGEKLERWGDLVLLRPDPQVIWRAQKPLRSYKGIAAIYERSSTGGGRWNYLRPVPEDFTVGWRELRFKLKLMGFKHTGLFPEQAVNWDRMGENAKLSAVDGSLMRYIVDDCFKFTARELRRGRRYDAVILDPPSFGRGPNGEKWKIEEGISDLAELVAKVLSDSPLFVCLNSYTTGLQPGVMANILRLSLPEGAEIDADEIGLNTEEGLVLPQGCTAFATFPERR